MKLNQVSFDNPMPNLTVIGLGSAIVYFSYSTIIAFVVNGKLTISKNVWSNTTGKHLNYVNSNKDIRIDNKEFVVLLEQTELL